MPDFSDDIDIGQDFEDYAPGTTQVTVQEIDPDDASVDTTSNSVTALKRITAYGEDPIGEGTIGATECKFWLRASQVSFAVRARCRIVDAEGITWIVGDANLVGFGNLWVCDRCIKLRS